MSNIIDDPSFVLAADGTIQNRAIAGDFLLCRKADQAFMISLDGTKYFVFDQGLKLRGLRAKGVKGIWCYATAGQITNVSFLIGDVEADDSRLNIVHDENQLLSVGAKEPLTYLNPSNANIAAGGTLTINGNNGGNQRAYLTIKNFDAVNVLSVQNGAGITGDSIDPDDKCTIVTSDTVKIFNPNGAAVAVAVMEVYYSPVA